MPGTVFLRGEHVTLTTIRPEDYAFIEAQFNDPSNRQRAGVSLPWSERKVADFVEDSDDTVQFLVCRDDTPVGHVVLTDLDMQAKNAELGWIVIRPGEQENGYATDAVGLCLDHAFDDRGLHKVWARVNEGTEASIRLLETHGFLREGTLRDGEYADGEYVDVYHYGLLAGERTSA
jgi:RimJ/RimL family protein N-acetyltransferase